MTGSAADAFAAAVGALVHEHPDVADVLARLLSAGAEVLGVDTAAVLADAGQGVALLASTSHRASTLEMLQAQEESGPCVECVATGVALTATGEAELLSRWPVVGRAILDAGYVGVDAYPLRWRGRALGGLNLFRSSAGRTDPDLGQAFADVACLVVAQAAVADDEAVRDAFLAAMIDRDVVEQAKGVLAQRAGIDLDRAYAELLDRATASGTSLSKVAAAVVRSRGHG